MQKSHIIKMKMKKIILLMIALMFLFTGCANKYTEKTKEILEELSTIETKNEFYISLYNASLESYEASDMGYIKFIDEDEFNISYKEQPTEFAYNNISYANYEVIDDIRYKIAQYTLNMSGGSVKTKKAKAFLYAKNGITYTLTFTGKTGCDFSEITPFYAADRFMELKKETINNPSGIWYILYNAGEDSIWFRIYSNGYDSEQMDKIIQDENTNEYDKDGQLYYLNITDYGSSKTTDTIFLTETDIGTIEIVRHFVDSEELETNLSDKERCDKYVSIINSILAQMILNHN